MKPLFIQYPQCGTCRKAAKWLQENNIGVASRHIIQDNPNEKELSEWIDKSGLPIQKFFNTSGQLYRSMNLKDKIKATSKNELISILASNGMLVKRPLLITDKTVLVGFKEEEWKSSLPE